MAVATEIAERVRSLAYEDLSEPAVRAAKGAVSDTLAVTLLGSRASSSEIVGALPGVGDAPGPCLILGTDRRTSALDAALVNGVAAHALDFDDLNETFGGHPSVPILPALLALAEERGASGRDLLAAFAAGVELEIRLARGVHYHHYEKGWHPTATLGVFGAAGACGYLLGSSTERLASALCIAVSLASGVKANFGTMTKPLHVGHCTRSGLFAALLAERGFDARLDAFEHPQGFLHVYNAPGAFDVERMLGQWFSPPAVLDPGIGVKQFACCGSAHPAIYAALALRRGHRLDPAAIRSVEVRAHPRRLPHAGIARPESGLEAKFSTSYCVARALHDGDVRLGHFEGNAHAEPAVRRIMEALRIDADGSLDPFGAEVCVVRADGERLTERVAHIVGRGPENPMPDDERYAKFRDCVTRALPGERIDPLWGALESLENLDSVRELTALMVPGVSDRSPL